MIMHCIKPAFIRFVLAGVWTVLGGRLALDAAPPPRLNLILISATNTRADHLGCYGYARATSPNIDAMGGRGLILRNAFSHASWTLPAAVSLFTSQYPFTHGLMNREESPALRQDVPTFVDVLNRSGYRTAAFVGDRDYGARHGHTSRFGEVFDPVKDAIRQDWKSYGVFGQTLPPARQWLNDHHKEPFCLLVQGYDTHCPFAIPAENREFDPNYQGGIDFTKCYWTFEPTRPIRRRTESGTYQQVYLLKTRPDAATDADVLFYPEDVHHMIALYDGEIRNVDRMLGGLFDDIERLGLWKNTVVVFYSDHGDMFGKHGRFMRGGPLRGTFYDDVLHIPVIIHHPGLRPRAVDNLVELIDLAPTLLDLLGLPVPASFTGHSFRSILEAPEATPDPPGRHVFAGSVFNPATNNVFFRDRSVILSARSREWKLIVERVEQSTGPRETSELYDLLHDPEELRDLSQDQPAKVSELRGRLHQWMKQIGATNVPGISPVGSR